MRERVAILVDGAFYLKKHYKHFGPKDAKKTAKDLQTHCIKHIDQEKEKLYRIFFYNCPPLKIKKHHPITNQLIDFSKTSLAIFSNELHKEIAQLRNFALRLGN